MAVFLFPGKVATFRTCSNFELESMVLEGFDA